MRKRVKTETATCGFCFCRVRVRKDGLLMKHVVYRKKWKGEEFELVQEICNGAYQKRYYDVR